MEKTKFELAVDILQNAKTDALLVLGDSPAISARVNHNITTLINLISHTAGIVIAPTAVADAFPPLTSFMGEAIKRVNVIDPSDAIVPADDKAIFKAKVEALYKDFPKLENDDILKGGNVEALVLRGVAKVAGVEDYADADLDFYFLDRIRAGMAAKAEVAGAEKASKAAATKKKTEPKEVEP